ncbi:uncharacterized protein LOC134303488 [Trichomycterus rosablanca]|uniref:uncharacterized protein LOC134303488 n=1 Tax=Trichomycterus rosablanca TaxID=2290929 RepID=UPI002F35920C
MPLTLSLSPAAVCQCFVLVSLCTAIADPNWIHVSNKNESDSKQLIYGVAFTLHAAENLTDTAPLGGVNGLGMHLLYTLAALCYAAVLLSSSSFVVDFLGTGFTRSRSRLVISLHISTVLLCLAVLAVSGACLYVIQENVQKGRLAWPSQASGFNTRFGESWYIAVFGLTLAIVAAVVSCKCPVEPVVPDQYFSVEHEHGETERLIKEAEPDRDEWGEASVFD